MDVTNTRGIFSLIDVRIRQNTGNWFSVPVSAVNYGYFMRATNSIRVDFSNDTDKTIKLGNLNFIGGDVVGNRSYAWMAPTQNATIYSPSALGNNTPSTTYRFFRMDYTSGITSFLSRGGFSLARTDLAAIGNESYGWFCGGAYTLSQNSGSGPEQASNVDRVDYSNDTGTTPSRGSISLARIAVDGTSNLNFGWVGGGSVPGAPTIYHSRVDRIDFANDTPTASPRGPLSTARSNGASTGNSSYGWFGGGAPTVSTVDRIDYSNDTATASPRGNLNFPRFQFGATGNSSYGWFSPGANPGPLPSTSWDRIDYSNDTSTASSRFFGSLVDARAVSASENGLSQEPLIYTVLSTYTWDSTFPEQQPPGFATNYGYITTSSFTKMARIDYTNDTNQSTSRGYLIDSRSKTKATGNSFYGYVASGTPSFPVIASTTVQRIDYSNDMLTAIVRGSISAKETLNGATGNTSYGWFGGGYTGPNTYFSTVDRIDYSNDNVTASPRGPLSTGRGRFSGNAVGNSSYGWFGGGSANQDTSIVDRINYANDTTTASIRGPMVDAGALFGSAGNESFGYFGAGDLSTRVSYIQRINYSNDTTTMLQRGSLNLATTNQATGNISYGYFTYGCTVDRIDYSNDTATASPRGNLSIASPSANDSIGCFSAAANALPQ